MVGEWRIRSQGHTTAVVLDARPDGGMVPRHCPHCGGAKLGQWGHADNGVQRLRCSACARTFAALRGTALAGLHDLAAFRLVLDDMMDEVHSSCRALAARLGLDKSTVWRWRKRINAALALGDRARVPWLLDGDVTTFRESRKASREWVNHRQDPARFPAPDRPRWVDVDSGRLPPPTPLERFMVSVRLGDDGSGRGIARLLPTGALAADGGKRLGPPSVVASRFASASASVSTGAEPSGEPPFEQVVTGGLVAAAVERSPCAAKVADPPIGQPAAHGLRERFRAFIRPFRGPATRHLHGYAAWFTIGSDASKDRRLARAWTLLLRIWPTEFADIRRGRAREAGAGSLGDGALGLS